MNLIIKSNILLLLFSLFLLLSCGGGSSGRQEPVGSLKQKYYFVIERYNNAFTPIFEGISIDENGDVFYFMVDEIPPPPPNGQITEQFLDTIFNDRKMFLETIDSAIFTQKSSLITKAATGQESTPIVACFDAGIYRYSAYTFNTFTGIYEKISVYRTGDVLILINNPAAVELRDWLIQIAIDNQIAFAGSICTGDFTSLSGP